METDRFVRCLRELSDFVSKYSFKDQENKLGDWRAIKQQLKNGDIQGLIYRKATEINIIYTNDRERQIEMFIKMKKQYEPLLNEALDNYCREHYIQYPLDSDIAFTIYFNNIEDFEKFIFKYLLPLAD